MGHRGFGQAGAVQAVPRPHQQGMAAAVPEQVSGDPPESRHAGSQTGGRPAGQLPFRPGLEQRVRDRNCRLIRHAFGHRGPQRRLQHGADPDRRRCRRRFDGQQAGLFQRRQRRAGALAAGRDVAAARVEIAGRRSGEDGLGNAVPVQQRGQGQQRLGRSVRRQLARPLERERPRHRGRRRPCAGRLRQLLPPAHEMSLILTARQRGVGNHRACLGQRDRLEVQGLSQFDRAVPLVRVG